MYARRQRGARTEQQRRAVEAAESARDATAAQAQSIHAAQLLRITDAALATLPLEELFYELLRRVCEGLPADAAALLLTEGPLHAPELRAAYGF